MTDAGRKCLRVVISGRVQGVWFRGWTIDEATRRGLDGWVRNRLDGTVEAVFAGAPESVGDMVEACWVGPPLAQVHQVAQYPYDEAVEPGFHHRPTV